MLHSPANATEAQRQDYLAGLRNTQAYKEKIAEYGTGSDMQRGIQAATAALQGLAGGNIAGALAGASAPELANIIGHLVGINDDEAAKAIAHAILGGVTAALQGNSAAAGAVGAASGELVATAIARQLYPDTDPSKLTEDQKQTVSTLATISAGMAGGIAGGNAADAAAGASAGKNSVENNALSLPSGMMNYGQAVASWNQYAQDNNLIPEQTQAGIDKLVKGDLPEGANIAKVIVDGYKDGVLIAGAGYLGPAASVGKVVGGAVLAEIANGSYQWFDLSQQGNENKNWDYKGSISAGITGALAPGRGVWQNVGMAAGGAVFSDGPDIGSIGIAAGGAGLGWGFGEYAPNVVSSLTGKEVPGFVFDAIGSLGTEFLGGYTKDLLNAPTAQKASEKEKVDQK